MELHTQLSIYIRLYCLFGVVISIYGLLLSIYGSLDIMSKLDNISETGRRSFLKFEIMHTIRAQRNGDNHKKKLA